MKPASTQGTRRRRMPRTRKPQAWSRWRLEGEARYQGKGKSLWILKASCEGADTSSREEPSATWQLAGILVGSRCPDARDPFVKLPRMIQREF